MSALGAMIEHRWYVLAFLAGFCLLGLAEQGALRSLVWLVTGTFLGWLAEFTSVRTGFPFGRYEYHFENFPDELWLGGVPLFASLSFAFMSYFAYSASRTLLGRLEGRGAAIKRVADVARDRSLAVAMLSAALCVCMDMVIDPLSLVGEHWFLGDLYHYEAVGTHLGIPASNYVGWFITVFSIVFVNQRLAPLLERVSPAAQVGFALPALPLLGIAGCAGVFLFILGNAAFLLATGRLPAEAHGSEILLSGAVLAAAFFAFVYVRLKSPDRWVQS